MNASDDPVPAYINIHARNEKPGGLDMLFGEPADLVGQIQPGDLLQDAEGNLLLVHQLVNPADCATSKEGQAVVAGQHYMYLFGTEIEYTPGYDRPGSFGISWPLRLVQVIPRLSEGEYRYLASMARYRSSIQDDYRYQDPDPEKRQKLKDRWRQIADAFHPDPWGEPEGLTGPGPRPVV